MSKQDKFAAVLELSKQYSSAIKVDSNNAIVVSKDAYKAAIGEDTYKQLADAHSKQLVINQAFAHAATQGAYQHMRDNSDVNTVTATIKQYDDCNLDGTLSRTTRVPTKDGVEATRPGGARWGVSVRIKSTGFKDATNELAQQFFGK